MKTGPLPRSMPALAVAAFLLTAASAPATVALLFGSSGVRATNWANGSGVGGNAMVWGILVDCAGDGFVQLNEFTFSGVNFATTSTPQTVINPNATTDDDVLVISPALMSLMTDTTDGATVGQNRISGMGNMPLTSGISEGDAFAIVWFNRTALTGMAQGPEKYGVFTNPLFVIPADGVSGDFGAPFAGPDPLKLMVPEPSALLLSALGTVGLMRRRR